MEGLFTSTSLRVSLGVSDSTDQGGEILPHVVGLRVKFGTDNHEGYCQYSVGTRGMEDEGNVILHQWHVNEEVISVDEVEVKLESFGLSCKDAERLKHGAKVLSLKVWGEHTTLCCEELQFQNPLLRWHNALCFPCVGSRWVPVCSWLCMITRVLKRCMTAVTKGWDDSLDDASLRRVVEKMLVRVTSLNAAHQLKY